MGNCWGSSPVDHYSSNTHPTIPNSPAVVKKGNSQGRDPVIRSAGSFGGVGVGRGSSGGSSGGVGVARGNSGGSANAGGTPGRDNKVFNNPNKVSVAPAVGKVVTPNPKVFTFAELRSATRNFKPATVLGEGGFGRVFKGWIDEETLAPSKVGVGMAVAVKKCSADSLQGVKEWQAEVDFLGKFSHPNLVRLVGYCWEDKELLLVYEYMRKGSLESHLFSKHVDPPSWGMRIKIAMDAARGLDFLHTSENTVIYRDFKAANILLDEDFNAKLSDFGLARLGPDNGKSHVTTQAVGTYGYAAPEYVATGHLYVKSDVYGFGVVLLEILTGLRAYDLNRPNGQHNLVDWYKPMLADRTKLKKIIDPRMGEHPPEGVQKLGRLILRCLEHDPKSRPSMSEVLIILERISTLIMKPSRTKPNALPLPRSSPSAHGHGRDREWVHPRHQGINRPGNTGPLR